MRNLRTTMWETANEVRRVFHRVMKLKTIAQSVTEGLHIQLGESRRRREAKVLQRKRLVDNARRILDESRRMVTIFEAFISQYHKRQHLLMAAMKFTKSYGKHGTMTGDVLMETDDQQPGCSGYQNPGRHGNDDEDSSSSSSDEDSDGESDSDSDSDDSNSDNDDEDNGSDDDAESIHVDVLNFMESRRFG